MSKRLKWGEYKSRTKQKKILSTIIEVNAFISQHSRNFNFVSAIADDVVAVAAAAAVVVAVVIVVVIAALNLCVCVLCSFTLFSCLSFMQWSDDAKIFDAVCKAECESDKERVKKKVAPVEPYND